MPNPTTAHGNLDCADSEALLAEAEAENARLHAEVADLRRRLDLVTTAKQNAFDENQMLRSRPELDTPPV